MTNKRKSQEQSIYNGKKIVLYEMIDVRKLQHIIDNHEKTLIDMNWKLAGAVDPSKEVLEEGKERESEKGDICTNGNWN